MGHARKLMIRGRVFGPKGPDVAFLRLPPKNIASFKGTNSFYNLGKRRDDVLAIGKLRHRTLMQLSARFMSARRISALKTNLCG